MDRPWYVAASFPIVVIGVRLVIAGFRRLDRWASTPSGTEQSTPESPRPTP